MIFDNMLTTYFQYLDRIAPGYQATLVGEDLYRFMMDMLHEEYETPFFYQHFLRYMGGDTGPALFPELSFHPKLIHDWYACHEGIDWTIPDAYHMLALPKQGNFYYYLAIDERETSEEVLVFRAEANEDLSLARHQNVCFYSLRDMLYHETCQRLHLTRFPQPVRVMRAVESPREMAQLVNDLDALLRRAQFQPVAGPSTWLRLYERSDMVLCVNHECSRGAALTIHLNGADEPGVEGLVTILTDSFPLAVSQF